MDNVSIDTSQSNKKLFKRFVIPMLITQVVSTIIQLGDRIIAVTSIGLETLSVVTIVFPVLMVGISFAIMIMSGLGIEVNYLIGKKEDKRAHGIATFTLVVMAILSVVLMSILLIFDTFFIDLLVSDNQAHIKADAIVYLDLIALAFPFMAVGFTFSTLILADGNPMYNMGGHMIFSIGNVLINIILVVVFKMGVAGLGLGTLLAALLFMSYNASYFIFKINRTFKIGKIIKDFKVLARLAYNGLSEFINVGAFGLMMIFLNRIIQDYMSVDFFTAYALLMMFTSIFIGAYQGAIFGMTPVISKLLGERNLPKIKTMAMYTFIRSLVMGIVIFLMVAALLIPIGGIFVHSEYENRDYVLDTLFLLYFTVGTVYLLNINSIFSSGYLSAVKKPALSLIVSISKTLIFIPVLVYILVSSRGDDGLFLGILAAELIFIPIMIFTYWLSNKLLHKELDNVEQSPVDEKLN